MIVASKGAPAIGDESPGYGPMEQLARCAVVSKPTPVESRRVEVCD